MPNYKNWMPKGMLKAMFLCLLVLITFTIIFLLLTINTNTYFIIETIISRIISLILLIVLVLFFNMYNKFSYTGKRKLMKCVAEGVVKEVEIKPGDKALDVGCGSGALAISLAKRCKDATVIGLDRWGAEYASFSKTLCETNSALEGATNTEFMQGDATKLPFENESFDAVVSNYVYHNIPSRNRQEILLETLKVLKKGGTFAIHDIFSKGKYGNMETFVKKLKDMGYEKVELVDTTNGMFMTKGEATILMLSGSKLLVGKK